jgi:LmbE family N-acetylglucosaminyl deacetylase
MRRSLKLLSLLVVLTHLLSALLHYGKDPRQVVYLTEQPRCGKEVNVAFVVHGGGFVGGNARGTFPQAASRYFLDRGFLVASVEYRLCDGRTVKWPVPLEDISAGVKYTLNFLKKKGLKVNKVVYIGSSAGAVAGGILLFAPPEGLGLGNLVDYFISCSGVYNPDSVSRLGSKTNSKCCSEEHRILPFKEGMRITAKTRVLLSEGKKDAFDLHPFTKDSHLEFMYRLLKSNGIPVKKVWWDGGHGCEKLLFKDEDPRWLNLLDEFLGLNGLKEQLKKSKRVMWVGAHPDDEMFLAGTLSYYTKDVGGEALIVAVYEREEMRECNDKVVDLLGRARYFFLSQLHGPVEDVSRKTPEEALRTFEKLRSTLSELVEREKPDVLITFEPTNGFRGSKAHAAIGKVASEVAKEKGLPLYYLINRDPAFFGVKRMDPLPITDVVELSERAWNDKMKIFRIYSVKYQKLKDPRFTEKLKRVELFRRAE